MGDADYGDRCNRPGWRTACPLVHRHPFQCLLGRRISGSLRRLRTNRSHHAISKAADKVMYATATPADKPLHIAHLFRAKIFGNRKWDETYKEIGLIQKEVHVGGGKYIKEWQVDPHIGYPEVYRRMSGLFDRMIEDGLMLKRE